MSRLYNHPTTGESSARSSPQSQPHGPRSSSARFDFSASRGESSSRRSSLGVGGDEFHHGPSGNGGSGHGSPYGHGERSGSVGDHDPKKRKIIRACDACRRKKIKCDGPMNSLSTSKCAHCQEYNLECTYVEAAKRRGPPKGYIETLEQRIGRTELLLRHLHPGVDFTDIIGPVPDRHDFELDAYQDTLRSLHIPPYPQLKPVTLPHSSGASPGSAATPSGSASGTLQILGPMPWKHFQRDPNRPPEEELNDREDAKMHADMARALNKLDIKDSSWRFHGKASLAHLFKVFNDLKYSTGPSFFERVSANKRNQYWQVPEYEVVIANEGIRPLDYTHWPAPDLANKLIDHYFEMVNFHVPLLNRPLFQRQYDSGMYKTNREFAKVCLMVLANGARFEDDERVYWPLDIAMTEEGKERMRTDADGTRKYSAGWVYLHMLLKMGRSIVQGPNLYDFQTQVLLCQFLHGSAIPHLTWLISGIGLRSAQEIGIHVRSTLLLANPVERALYNRAFWCLYHVDRTACAAIGRSVALQDADFDADYPIAVDDEFWETGDPEKDFKQPPSAGVPKVAAFIHMLKLDHIIGAALRTIYAVNRLPERGDVDSQRAIVVELDSALNSWADAVPDGLRWDPTRADQGLFQQSAVLYSHYYLCQIMIHRPFIPTPKHPETVGLPSLAICSNASRSICNILDAVLRRGRQFAALPGQAMNVHFLFPAWTAAIILMVSMYSGKQQLPERDRARADVQKCIAALKEIEVAWRQAGKMVDMLVELATERGPQVHEEPPKQGEKRSYDAGAGSTGQGITPLSAASSAAPSDPPTRVKTPPHIIGLPPYHGAQSWLPSGPDDPAAAPIPADSAGLVFDPSLFDVNNDLLTGLGMWSDSGSMNMGLSGGPGAMGGFGDVNTAGDDLWAQLFAALWTPGGGYPGLPNGNAQAQ